MTDQIKTPAESSAPALSVVAGSQSGFWRSPTGENHGRDSDPTVDGNGCFDFFSAGIMEAIAERDKLWQDGNATLRHERDVARQELVDYKAMMHEKGP